MLKWKQIEKIVKNLQENETNFLDIDEISAVIDEEIIKEISLKKFDELAENNYLYLSLLRATILAMI